MRHGKVRGIVWGRGFIRDVLRMLLNGSIKGIVYGVRMSKVYLVCVLWHPEVLLTVGDVAHDVVLAHDVDSTLARSQE